MSDERESKNVTNGIEKIKFDLSFTRDGKAYTLCKATLRIAPTRLLLDLANRAVTDHRTGSQKSDPEHSFMTTYGVDFSYTTLTTEIKRRGYVHVEGWCQPGRPVTCDEEGRITDVAIPTAENAMTVQIERTEAQPELSHENPGEDVTGKEDVVVLQKPQETCKQTYMVGTEVAKSWREFNAGFPYKSVAVDTALLRYMADVKEGRLRFEYRYGHDEDRRN